MQDWLKIWKSINITHQINRLKKKKKSHDDVIDAERAFDKILHPIMTKNP